jgi:DGQHR domain-containing protein
MDGGVVWEIPALKISQKGMRSSPNGPLNVDLYLTTLSAKDLIDETRAKVDRWSPENPDGYQRPLTRARKSQVKDYLLEEEGLFPTSILLNCRGNVEFEEKGEGGFGLLRIPKESLPLYIVDGQHRIEGLKYTIIQGFGEFLDYPLPVVIMNQKDKTLEVSMFYKINKRQRGVPVDIAERNIQRLLEHPGLKGGLEQEKLSELKAAQYLEILDYLNNEPTSPWYKRIQMPGEPKKDKWIRQSIFAKALAKMIIMNSTLLIEPKDKLKTFLLNYWKVLRDLYPNALGERAEDYVLVRSQGVRAFTYLAGAIYMKCKEKGSFSQDTIKEFLSKIKDTIDEEAFSYENGEFIATNERAVEDYYEYLLGIVMK